MTPPDPAAREAPDEQKWEKVIPNLYRVRVPSGWIYQGFEDTSPMCFVPDPVTIHGAAEKRAEEMTTRAAQYELAMREAIDAIYSSKSRPASGAGGMTIDANIRNTVYHVSGTVALKLETALAQETPIHECDHEWVSIIGGRQCQKCKGVDLDRTTCNKCGAKAVAFICNELGCPVNGGSAHD